MYVTKSSMPLSIEGEHGNNMENCLPKNASRFQTHRTVRDNKIK